MIIIMWVIMIIIMYIMIIIMYIRRITMYIRLGIGPGGGAGRGFRIPEKTYFYK